MRKNATLESIFVYVMNFTYVERVVIVKQWLLKVITLNVYDLLIGAEWSVFLPEPMEIREGNFC